MAKRLPYSATPPERFERMYQPVPFSGCWIWTGALSSDGYGAFHVDGHCIQAHKFAYEQRGQQVPEGLELDHLCRIRCCVNPAHVEPVSHQLNMLRGAGVGSANAAKTHCKRGHPFDEPNTYARKGGRVCRICNREDAKRYRERRSA